jgi:metallo-beta-lactamase class B
MKRRSFLSAGFLCCFGALAIPIELSADDEENSSEGMPQALELGMKPMTRLAKTVWIGRLAPQLWLHSTTELIAGGYYYPANGVILELKGASLLIDTGYRPDQAQTLLQWSKQNLAEPISLAFVTHFHKDRTGGIPALEKHGIRTLAHPLTCDLARANGLPVPRPIRNFDRNEHRLATGCELYFPGAGHTKDNVVVWFRRQQALFGGCLLKSITSNGLGNLTDANVPEWVSSLNRVRERYPNPMIVVPGHGTIAGDAIGTTLRLISDTQTR